MSEKWDGPFKRLEDNAPIVDLRRAQHNLHTGTSSIQLRDFRRFFVSDTTYDKHDDATRRTGWNRSNPRVVRFTKFTFHRGVQGVDHERHVLRVNLIKGWNETGLIEAI